MLEVREIRDTLRELAAPGVSVGTVTAVGNGWLASFKDPDGNELVLWQYALPC